MTRTDHEPLAPLPGQLTFPFMAEPGPVERPVPRQGNPQERTNGLTGRAREVQTGKHPARGTTSGKGGTRDG
jgi:hypothetical protein